jgi:hypothetical protein
MDVVNYNLQSRKLYDMVDIRTNYGVEEKYNSNICDYTGGNIVQIYYFIRKLLFLLILYMCVCVCVSRWSIFL